jgi:hypothetical protein
VNITSIRHGRPPSLASSIVSPPMSGVSAPTFGAVHSCAYTGTFRRSLSLATPPQ